MLSVRVEVARGNTSAVLSEGQVRRRKDKGARLC